MPEKTKKRPRRGFFQGISDRVGLPPGSLLYTGETRSEEAEVALVTYDEKGLEEKRFRGFDACPSPGASKGVTWIHVSGIYQAADIERLGNCYKIHPLILEDVLDTRQHPKVEDLGDYLCLILKMVRRGEEDGCVAVEQVSIILGADYVLSFEEGKSDLLRPILDRLKVPTSRLRRAGADYLAYGLLDIVVDNFFIVLESLGERIDLLEEQVIGNPAPETLNELHRLRRELIVLRRSIWPLREAVAALERRESSLIRESTFIYLRDVYEHIVQILDVVETLRDTLASILDLYLSSVSNRLNAIMKVLTIIATVFMPLTFITGLYGMNVPLPGAESKTSFNVILFAMLVLVALMLGYFKSRKWL
ncbi:MAG: magnesium/cobalt transporter CorA [Acidobacteriota bacterium]